MKQEVTWPRAVKFDDREMRLLEYLRNLKFGEVTIKVQDGLPVMVEKAMEKVKL